MKKIILVSIIALLYVFLLSFSKNDKSYLTVEEEYLKNNNLTEEDLEPFLKYKNFKVTSYLDYKAYLDLGFTHLESINLVNDSNYYNGYKDTKNALFVNQNIVLVNKHFSLDNTFIPENLSLISNYNINYIKRTDEQMKANKDALNHLEKMSQDALEDGVEFIVYSAYRDYLRQEYLYYVVNLENDFYSAKPGHSEHQTGLAFDISDISSGLTIHFKDTSTFKWLYDNAHLYGFILRYPKEKENITLFKYEPWHFRYVGNNIASFIKNNKLSFEEYILQNYEL